MKATLNDLLNAKGVSEPLREAVKVLIDRIDAVEKERDALRAKIAEMEKQEPVAYLYEYVSPMDGKTPVWRAGRGEWNGQHAKSAKPLYLAPAAQDLNLSDPAVQKRLAAQWGYVPAQSVPTGWKLVPIEPTEEMFRAMTDPFIAINGDNRKAFESAYKAMLAAAPKMEEQ